MKIAINYELLDKAREAKTGFSLRKYAWDVGSCMGLASPFWTLYFIAENVSPLQFLEIMTGLLTYYCCYFKFIQKNVRVSLKNWLWMN